MSRKIKKSLLNLILASTVLAGTECGEAAERIGAIRIPAQSLAQSLREIARQTGENILFAPDATESVRAPAVNGEMSAREAIERLIAGTDLEVVSDGGRGLVVRVGTPKQSLVQALAPSVAGSDVSREFVIVTGIRSSLQRNLDIKRGLPGLVDAITSENIGKFPESNLAVALMRIPGVSVNRGVIAMMGIDSSMGDPVEVTVRGFGPTFNQVLFDGRKIGSGVGSRSFDFSLLNTDSVEEVDVLKSPNAALPAGAIGATINVKNPKPFDYYGPRFAASTSTSYAPDEGRFTPNGAVLFSDTFANDKLGVLLAAAYTETKNRSNESTIWGWEGVYLDRCQFAGGSPCGSHLEPDTSRPVWFVQDYGIYQIHNWNMRENGRAAVQWNPNDAVLLTWNADFARNDRKEWQYDVAVWNNASEMREVTTSKNGTITSFTRQNTPTDFGSQVTELVLQSYNVGFNLQWRLSSDWSAMADFDLAQSASNPGGRDSNYGANVGYGPSCSEDCTQTPRYGNNVGIIVTSDGGHTLPYYSSYGPNGDSSNFLNPNILGSHVMVLDNMRNRNSVRQAHLQATWEGEDLRLSFGAQYLADHMRLSLYDDFTNNQWQAYAGYGPDSNNYYATGANAGQPAGVHLPSSLFTSSFSTAGFIPGWKGNGALPSRIWVYDAQAVYRYLESLGQPTSPTSIPGFNWGCCDPAYKGKFEVVENPSSHQYIAEDNYSAYITLSGNTALWDLPLSYHAGLRLEHTSLRSEGLGRLPTTLTVMPSDHTAFMVTYGPMQEMVAHNSYDYLLPNVDLTLSLTDDVLLRLDASRALARPPLNSLSPATTFSASERVGSLVAAGQNPSLMPYTAANFDVALEWYYAPHSYFSADAYVKDVSNFIISATKTEPLGGVIDPTTGEPAQFRVTSYINGPSAAVYGLEVALQHMFGDSGFGVQANATVVETNRPYNPYDISTSNFAVTGLADSANLVLFYDRDGLQFRLATNWRDSFLDHFGQMQPNSAFGAEPVFVNPSWDMSLRTSYDLSDHLTVYFEATNLLNSTYSTRGRFPEQVLDVVAYGRLLTSGLHYRL